MIYYIYLYIDLWVAAFISSCRWSVLHPVWCPLGSTWPGSVQRQFLKNLGPHRSLLRVSWATSRDHRFGIGVLREIVLYRCLPKSVDPIFVDSDTLGLHPSPTIVQPSPHVCRSQRQRDLCSSHLQRGFWVQQRPRMSILSYFWALK